MARTKSGQNEQLIKGLSSLVNRLSRENESGTPDFVLAKYLLGCLEVFEETVVLRDEWHGNYTKEFIKKRI